MHALIGQGLKDIPGWLSNDSQNCNTNDLENEMEQNVTCPWIAPSLAKFQSRKIDFHLGNGHWGTGQQLVKGFTCDFVQVKEVARAMTGNNLKL